MKRFIPKITLKLKRFYPGEIITAALILGLINYFYYPDSPGLFNSNYNPYFIIIVFFSCFYGKISGIFSLLFSIIAIAVNILINSNFNIYIFSQAILSEENYYAAVRFFFMSLILSILLGEIRDSLGANIQNLKNNTKQLDERVNKLDQELKAVSLVNEEYQDRILGQQNSLISLYSTMISLNSLDLEKIYPNILEAIVKFSGASKCSLWQYLRDERMLQLIASFGWDDKEISAENRISDSTSITGWVARNNEIFSVKLLQKHSNLLEIDQKQNIITVPINIDNHVWGIINIEEMPFVKYNLYSERLVMMIADLSAPIINNAVRFDEISKKGEIDTITGLPSIDEMFSVIRDEYTKAVRDNVKLSLIIFEISNINDMSDQFNDDQKLLLMRDVIEIIKQESRKDTMIFQYKEKYQFSLILPNVDYDGAAMMCLSFIEKISTREFQINEIPVQPEIIVGYSSVRENLKSEEDLMMLADNLLELQKI